MKFALRFLCFIIILAVFLLSVGCGDNTSSADNGGFFALVDEPVKVIDTYSKTGAKLDRLVPNYTEQLTPSDSYGELVPFINAYNTYKSSEKTDNKTFLSAMYGLCTVTGKIVVDAVFNKVIRHENSDGGFIYELIIGSDNSTYKKGTRYVSASDGSWVFKVPKNSEPVCAGNGTVMFKRYRTVKDVTTEYYDFYSFKGRKIFTFDTSVSENKDAQISIGCFYDGVAAVNISKKGADEKETFKTAYYIDAKGKKAFDKEFTYCSDFISGFAVVIDENGKYGVLDKNGEYFINPNYRKINYNAEKGYFTVAESGVFKIFDTERKEVGKVFTERGDVKVVNSEKLIYQKTNADTNRNEYFYLDGNTPFTCRETGQFPDSDAAVGGLFICSYNKTSVVFNENGDTVADISDLGKLSEVFGEYVVGTDKNNNKTCVIVNNSNKEHYWIDMQYQDVAIGERYIVLKNSTEENSYALYDIVLGKYVYENCRYIEVFLSSKSAVVAIATNDRYLLLDESLNILISKTNETRF